VGEVEGIIYLLTFGTYIPTMSYVLNIGFQLGEKSSEYRETNSLA
jgi:hypothetical protein